MSDSQVFLQQLLGSWAGTSRCWFKPGELADESSVEGSFFSDIHKNFIRHRYEGSMQGNQRFGEETIVFNPARDCFQVAWIDSFHMSQGVMLSEGKFDGQRLIVGGTYGVAPGSPEWGWRTEYEMVSENEMLICAYNVTPEGEEGLATETKYQRQTTE